MEQQTNKKALTLKTLTKSSVWDIQENDIFRLWEGAEKDAEVKDNARHFVDIIRSAFMIEEINSDSDLVKTKFEKLGYKVGQVKLDENAKVTWAIKKRPIMRVTDLTYENIRHISATKLIEVLDRNFGGGWDSLSQSIKDIIESGFDISTTTLPKDRLHKKGGMYEKKVEDGFEVLEVAKGTWVEAIFAKAKPESEKPRMKFASSSMDDEDDDADVEIEDNYNKPDEDDIEISDPNDEDITEENYSTMMDLGSGDPDEEAENMSDYGEE
ncbi:hypothetical protein [Xylanibacter brevis]|jgi:hypothetical protein|uniref:hypothetical protein n=1 Tax=Xylanibacter brevis TaxID=83231 RepID=UPI000485ED95|nr:hypothetical protein [Xylanibacter brevis]